MTEEAGGTKPAQTHNASTPDQGYVVLVWADESIGATTTRPPPMPESLMADFEVAYVNDVLTPYSGDAARYEINPQSGVLTVFDGDGQRFHFSPSGWLSVRDEAPVSVYGTHTTTTG